MILPAYAISSFDATGNAAEETKNAARNAAWGPCWPTLPR